MLFRQATLFRFEATTVRTGSHLEKDSCVRIIAHYPADAYLSAEKDDIDHESHEKSHAFAHVCCVRTAVLRALL